MRFFETQVTGCLSRVEVLTSEQTLGGLMAVALFLFLPAVVIYFFLLHYFYRRIDRLTIAEQGAASDRNFRDFQNRADSRFGFIAVVIICLLLSFQIDNRWDDFRHLYDIDVRSTGAQLLIGFATVGVIATCFSLFLCLVELYDWLKARYGKKQVN